MVGASTLVGGGTYYAVYKSGVNFTYPVAQKKSVITETHWRLECLDAYTDHGIMAGFFDGLGTDSESVLMWPWSCSALDQDTTILGFEAEPWTYGSYNGMSGFEVVYHPGTAFYAKTEKYGTWYSYCCSDTESKTEYVLLNPDGVLSTTGRLWGELSGENVLYSTSIDKSVLEYRGGSVDRYTIGLHSGQNATGYIHSFLELFPDESPGTRERYAFGTSIKGGLQFWI